MTAVRITSFSLEDRPFEDGSYRLGFFDCEASGIKLAGCCLMRFPDGVSILTPVHQHRSRAAGRLVGVKITDDELRREMVCLALRQYALMGGALPEGDLSASRASGSAP